LKIGLGWLFKYYIANSAGRRERSNSIGKRYKLIYWRDYLSRLLGVSTKTTRIKSRNNSGQNPLSASESSSNGSHLQTTAVTSMPQHHEISISLLRMRAGIKPELSHSRAARSGLPAESDTWANWKGKGQGDVLGLGYRYDHRCGKVERRYEMEKDKKRREV
jgi:hypothetical protein